MKLKLKMILLVLTIVFTITILVGCVEAEDVSFNTEDEQWES